MLLYHCLYISIPRTKKFNSIIFNHINNKNISIDLNRFKTIKNVIITDSINKRTIKIAFNKTIIINFIILKLKIIIKRKKLELFSLLQRFEISIISKRNKCFLKKAKEACKVKEMG